MKKQNENWEVKKFTQNLWRKSYWKQRRDFGKNICSNGKQCQRTSICREYGEKTDQGV